MYIPLVSQQSRKGSFLDILSQTQETSDGSPDVLEL